MKRVVIILCALLISVAVSSCQNGTPQEPTSSPTEEAECNEPAKGVSLSPYPVCFNQEVMIYLPGFSGSIQDTLLLVVISDSSGDVIREYGGAKPFPKGLAISSGEGWEWEETFTSGEPGRWTLKAEIRKSISLGDDYEEVDGSFCVNEATSTVVVESDNEENTTESILVYGAGIGDSDTDIYLVTYADLEYKWINLTSSFANEKDASFSPDGRRIVFASERDDNYEIFTMNVDKSGLTRHTANSWDDYNPAWSPDGKKIAFFSDTEENKNLNHIKIMDSNGRIQNITPEPGYYTSLSWSPDSRELLFCYRENRYLGDFWEDYICVMSEDSSRYTKLQPSFVKISSDDGSRGISPSWTHDGKHIMYVNQCLFIMNKDGSQAQCIHRMDREDPYYVSGFRILSEPLRNGTHVAYYSLSPDGNQVAFTGDDGNLMSLDTTFENDLRFKEELRLNAKNKDMIEFFEDIYLVELAHLTEGFDTNNYPFGNIFWSPDGEKILFSTGDGRYLWTVTVNGGALEKIECKYGRCFPCGWRPS